MFSWPELCVICRIVTLTVTHCYLLLLYVTHCYLMLLTVTYCYFMLLTVTVTHCYLLIDTAKHCKFLLMLHTVTVETKLVYKANKRTFTYDYSSFVKLVPMKHYLVVTQRR